MVRRFKNRTWENTDIRVRVSVRREETIDAGENLEDDKALKFRVWNPTAPRPAKKSCVSDGKRASSWTLRQTVPSAEDLEGARQDVKG